MLAITLCALPCATRNCCHAEEALESSNSDNSEQAAFKSTDENGQNASNRTEDVAKGSSSQNQPAEDAKPEAPKAENAGTDPKPEDAAKPKDDKDGGEKKPDPAKDTGNPDPDAPVPPPEPSPEELARRKEKAAEYQSLGEKKFQFPVTGSILTRYRMRHGIGETDQDISEFLTADIGNKAQIASGHIDAQAFESLDKHHTHSSNIFTSLLDTYDRPFVARLYSAYVDFNHISGIDVLRVGRQFDFDTPEILQYDGLRLDTTSMSKLENLTLSFYGGVPVHEYEKSNTGDWLAGMAAEIKPWDHTRLRFDYIHINDNFSDWVTNTTDSLKKSLSPIGGTRTNDLTSLSFWQAFKDPNIHLNGHFSLIDGEAREATVRTVYNNAEKRLQVSGTYSAWFKPETQFVTEFDPYYETLKGMEPYQNGSVKVSKGFLEWLWLDAGADSRRLLNNGTAKIFNREFDRFYATLQTHNLLKKGLSMSVTATRWEGKDGAPTTTQVGGEIGYQWRKHLETFAGTDYALYKYDLFQNTEHDQDRTYYLRQRWKPTRWASLDARYEFEQSRSQNFHTFTMQFRFDF